MIKKEKEIFFLNKYINNLTMYINNYKYIINIIYDEI